MRIHHLAFRSGDIARLERFYVEVLGLARAGVAVEAATEFTLYVRDPDGRRVGLSSYPLPLA